ncbi:Zn-dependent protease with chaperone function [Paenibacillus rhizosphaerae]|uniref:Zn-dependent protease with chaperone function n=1 Tax=Paenibacillus rhizosphaerae TaxID=297318 RepID=A0A839TTS8_9BACL|nr:M56 family metallopeptidase [Paenibacillus rhizosphaerae]MBB3128689.1 Zn-dependent protease with chaperone function [Paenibacillus rhizosphaerae]
MKSNPFSTLLLPAGLFGIGLLIALVVFADAAVHTAFDRMTSFSGFSFSNSRIPVTFFVLVFLIFVIVFLFMARAIQVLRNTYRSLKPFQYRLSADIPSAVKAFSASKNIPVLVTKDAEPIAFAYGFIRPRIMISQALLQIIDGPELIAIMEHEYYHCVKKDPLRMLVSHGICCSMFFFPVLRRLRSRYFLKKELAADEYAVRRAGQKALAIGLFKLSEIRVATPPLDLTSPGIDDLLGSRIDALVSNQVTDEPIPIKEWIVSAISLMLILVLLTHLLLSLSPVV